jgi:hypothetical protein
VEVVVVRVVRLGSTLEQADPPVELVNGVDRPPLLERPSSQVGEGLEVELGLGDGRDRLDVVALEVADAVVVEALDAAVEVGAGLGAPQARLGPAEPEPV